MESKNIVSALMNGKVEMVYTKRNGVVREAIGTLNLDIIAKQNTDIMIEVLAKEVEKAIGTNRYFDLYENAWRRYSTNSNVKIIG